MTLSKQPFQSYNEFYSPEFEKDCFEFSGKDFLSVLTLAGILEINKYAHVATRYLQIIKAEDNDSKVFVNVTDGRMLCRLTLTTLKNSIRTGSFNLPLHFLSYFMYSKKISENDTVKLFKGKDYLFLKVNDELYSTFFKDIKYASFERAIPYNQPYKAEFSSNELRDFVDSCKQDTNGFDFTFENGQLSLHSTKNKKVISCTYNCEEGFSLRLSVKNAVALTNFYKEKIILEMKESASAVKIDTDNLLTVFMPMKQNV